MSPYLSLFIGDGDRVELAAPINRAMEELMDGIHTSPAIPSDFKLGKKLMLGSFTASPSSVPSNMTDCHNLINLSTLILRGTTCPHPTVDNYRRGVFYPHRHRRGGGK
jgi:hypothetical protein